MGVAPSLSPSNACARLRHQNPRPDPFGALLVSLALSAEQADWLENAVAEHHRIKKLLTEMRRLSRKIMRARFPDVERRSPLNKKVLRLI
jgi:hypothetical protein